jgi:hypothetical protein
LQALALYEWGGQKQIIGAFESDEVFTTHLIDWDSIIIFLHGSITPLSHLFLRSLATLMKQRVLGICLLLTILLWMMLMSINFCLSLSI